MMTVLSLSVCMYACIYVCVCITHDAGVCFPVLVSFVRGLKWWGRREEGMDGRI